MPENETREAQPAAEANGEEKPKKLRYHLLKSNSFRTIYADGVFGGVTPRLSIAATFFNERHPLPDQLVHAINEDGTLGSEIREERIARDGIVRELEANIIMDVMFAKALVGWLNEKIAFIEKRIEEAQQEHVSAAEESSNAGIS